MLEERRDVATHDSLRETFDDRSLADTRFTNQNGIVLRATAKDLNDAFDLCFATDQWIKFVIRSVVGQIARELDEVRRVFLL